MAHNSIFRPNLFAGQTIIVTGGGTGIGRATAHDMIGLYYLMAYEGGPVQPGDDMIDSAYRWWSLDELADERLKFRPSTHRWMLKRAVELYRLWKDQDVPLQPAL